MKTFRELLRQEFADKEFEAEYYKELEKARIAIEIAYHREQMGMTQEELARRIGSSQSAVARLENPNYKGYSLKVLRRIADVFGLELVVSFHKKGEEVYEKETTVVYQTISWPHKKDGYKFKKLPVKKTASEKLVA